MKNQSAHEAFDKSILLDKISKQVPGAIYQFLMNPEGKTSLPFTTEGIWDIFEVTPDEVKEDATKAFSRIHPDDYDHVVKTIKESFETMNLWKFEFRVILPQKGLSWIRGLARPEKLSDGSVLWHGYLREINELKEAKREVETFFEINLDLLCIADLKGNFIRVNKTWERLLGYSPEYLQSKNSLDFVHPDDKESTLEATQKFANQNQVVDFVNKYRAKDGEYKHLEWRGHTHGKFIYAAARDITERINAEAEASHMNDLLEYIIEHNRSAVAVHDKDLNYLYVSKKYLETFRVKEDDIIGKHHYEVFPDLPHKWRVYTKGH